MKGFTMRGLLAGVLMVSAMALMVAGPAPALAGPPICDTVTLGTSTGAGSYTNSRDFYPIKVVSIETFGALSAASTVTVSRIRDTRTNTTCAIINASGAGVFYATNTLYLFKGDVLKFSSSPATGAVAEIVGELIQ